MRLLNLISSNFFLCNKREHWSHCILCFTVLRYFSAMHVVYTSMRLEWVHILVTNINKPHLQIQKHVSMKKSITETFQHPYQSFWLLHQNQMITEIGHTFKSKSTFPRESTGGQSLKLLYNLTSHFFPGNKRNHPTLCFAILSLCNANSLHLLEVNGFIFQVVLQSRQLLKLAALSNSKAYFHENAQIYNFWVFNCTFAFLHAAQCPKILLKIETN